MGWPRKNEVCRLYQEKKDKSYLLVNIIDGRSNGTYGAIGNALTGSSPSLASTGASPGYLLNKCRRVEWSELPLEWQDAFWHWLESDCQHPSDIRGFWRIGNKPKKRESLATAGA
jgi:hypothetical protein